MIQRGAEGGKRGAMAKVEEDMGRKWKREDSQQGGGSMEKRGKDGELWGKGGEGGGEENIREKTLANSLLILAPVLARSPGNFVITITIICLFFDTCEHF